MSSFLSLDWLHQRLVPAHQFLRHIVTLQCSYSVSAWRTFEEDGGLRCQLNLNFEIIISLDSCCFRYFSCGFAIGLVLSRKCVLISILNTGYWTKSNEWFQSYLTFLESYRIEFTFLKTRFIGEPAFWWCRIWGFGGFVGSVQPTTPHQIIF